MPGPYGRMPDSSVYQGPSCPQDRCGTCYKVTNPAAGGASVIVKIVDVCPINSAYNYCKNLPPEQRCGSKKNA